MPSIDPEFVENLMSRIEQLETRLKKMEENEMIKYVLDDPKYYDRQDDVIAARLNGLLSHLNVKISVEMTHDYENKQHNVDKVMIEAVEEITGPGSASYFNKYTMDADCEALGSDPDSY